MAPTAIATPLGGKAEKSTSKLGKNNICSSCARSHRRNGNHSQALPAVRAVLVATHSEEQAPSRCLVRRSCHTLPFWILLDVARELRPCQEARRVHPSECSHGMKAWRKELQGQLRAGTLDPDMSGSNQTEVPSTPMLSGHKPTAIPLNDGLPVRPFRRSERFPSHHKDTCITEAWACKVAVAERSDAWFP